MALPHTCIEKNTILHACVKVGDTLWRSENTRTRPTRQETVRCLHTHGPATASAWPSLSHRSRARHACARVCAIDLTANNQAVALGARRRFAHLHSAVSHSLRVTKGLMDVSTVTVGTGSTLSGKKERRFCVVDQTRKALGYSFPSILTHEHLLPSKEDSQCPLSRMLVGRWRRTGELPE